MGSIQKHLRNTFLTGLFAAIPLAVTAFVVVYVESKTRSLFGFRAPFVALLLTVAGVYVLGLVVSSIVGRFFLGLIDRTLSRIPVVSDVYEAWKHVSLTPGGKEGMFARPVLIGGDGGRQHLLGFSSGDPVPGNPDLFCVFVPAAPNPVAGRLYFVARSDCRFLDMPAEEAFKIILSSGNYVPHQVGAATAAAGITGSVAAAPATLAGPSA